MIDHGDILTFLMLQEFITVVIRVMWLHHGLLYTVNGCHVMARKVLRIQLTLIKSIMSIHHMLLKV